jgi:NAD(P) transhydrogenase
VSAIEKQSESESWDIVVIGSGPAGQKAAIQGAKAGRRVLMVEQDNSVGGACVHHGTIPSKTLRETAVALTGFRRRSGHVFEVTLREDLQMASLLARVDQVIQAHETFIVRQLQRNGVDHWHGRARFAGPHELEVEGVDRRVRRARGDVFVIATGSRPRTPPEVPIDHEHVLDSDSILSMRYLPASLTVIGAGVIACEYASVFAALGVKVTMIDRGARPLLFLDPEIVARFVEGYQRNGGQFIGGRSVRSVVWDGLSTVQTTLDDGAVVESEKMLYALGRVANVERLRLEAAGLATTSRGLLAVDEHLRTSQPHIYAVGDVIGPPSLASSSMEQGRRAICHALGLPVGGTPELIPVGVYTVPEMSSVGLTEEQVIERFGCAVVGRARFDEIARGQIAAIEDGMLKMVAGPDGRRLLGVQIVGEGASELIHLGQMALASGASVDTFVDSIFNFPTLAEAYRVAALDIAGRRGREA